MKVTDPKTILPSGWHILLKTEKIETVTASGIQLMTDAEENRQQTGHDLHEVVAVGRDCYHDKEKFPNGPWCEVGDIVVTTRYIGHKMEIEGELYWFANDEEILAIVE